MGLTNFEGLGFGLLGHPLDGAPIGLVNRLSLQGGGDGYASDFMFWEGPTAEGTTAGWTLSGAVGTSTALVSTSAPTGALVLSTSGTADDNACLEYKGNLHYVVGKRLWCYAKLALSDADDMEAYFGLGTPGATDFVATLPAEGIFFSKAETATKWSVQVRDGGTSTTSASNPSGLTLADATSVVIGFTVDPKGNITPYWTTDPTARSWTAGTTIVAGTANLPDDAADELSLYFACETGATAVASMTIDWVLAAQER